MEGGGIFAWTRGRRAYIDYIKAHAKIPWMSFTTKNKAYVKLVRSNIPPHTLNAWGSVLAKGKSNSEKIDKQRNNFLVFKLEHVWKKRAKSGDPRLHTEYVALLLVKRTEQNNLLRMLLRMSVNNIEWLWERERTSTKQKNKKKTIHSPAISSILSLFGAK